MFLNVLKGTNPHQLQSCGISQATSSSFAECPRQIIESPHVTQGLRKPSNRITKGIDMTPMGFTNINHWFPLMMPAKKNTLISWGLAERYGVGTVAMSPFRRDLPRHGARVSTKSGSFEGRVAGGWNGATRDGETSRNGLGWMSFLFL